MNDVISEEQAILSTLSPAMRRAILAATWLNDDPDRLTVTISPDVTIGTVVALIGRGLVEHAANSRTRDHELTDRGLCVLHALRALRDRGEAGTERVDRRAASLARKLQSSALVHHVRPHTVSTVMLLLVREGVVTGVQADRFNAVMQELDRQVAAR